MVDLDELERLLDNAADGDWEIEETTTGVDLFAPEDCDFHPIATIKHNFNCRAPTCDVDNFELIAALRNAAPELIKMARRWKHLEKQFRIYQADIGNRHTWIWTVSGANTMRGATFADAVDTAILSNSVQSPTELR